MTATRNKTESVKLSLTPPSITIHAEGPISREVMTAIEETVKALVGAVGRGEI
jgi:hypothetical protein